MTRSTKIVACIVGLAFAFALVTFALGSRSQDHTNKQLLTATKAQLADKSDQVRTLRVQRDGANRRADLANTRADAITHAALSDLHAVRCIEVNNQAVGAALARLIYASPTVTPSERVQFAPFLHPPVKPKDCP